MRKVALLLTLILSCALVARASHIYGGEMIYETLSIGPTSKKYRITLMLFRDNLGGGAELPSEVWIGLFDYGTKSRVSANAQSTHTAVPRRQGPSQVGLNIQPCVSGDISGDYAVAYYWFEVELPINEAGYIAAYETCCRVNGLTNVYHPGSVGGGGSSGGTGSTYVVRIPGTDQLAADQTNKSPRFGTSLDLVCHDRPFTWNFGAEDPDGDQLVYSFVPGYDKTIAENSGNVPPATPAANPDYPTLDYINGYSAITPLGNRAFIDEETGVISGIAPPTGKYVVAVMVREFRNGKQIGEHRKDFILRVQDCEVASATLRPEYISCDGYSFTFSNESPPSPLVHSYSWDFGVAGTDTDVSNLPTAQFTFPDTGIYSISLTVNKGEACEVTATSIIKVYPGFFPDFTFSGICANRPTQFTDRTTARYGTVNKWSWDFGNTATANDISSAQHPSYTYSTVGSKTVRFIVSSSKGCIDTVVQNIDILDKPPITMAFKDTLICNGDQVQLGATGDGTITWDPGPNMTGQNTSTPTVSPTATASYFVELNQSGCINRDTARVRVVNFVTLQAMPDTTICAGDEAQLRVASDGLRYQWTPAQTLNDPTLKAPVAIPTATTTYQVRATIGSCAATDEVRVALVPYPGANAGRDTVICFNTQAQLRASINGRTFSWSPANTLNDPTSLTPVARPPATTEYVLTVRDVIGCPKPGRDTVLVTVLEEVVAYAGRDTSVVIGQPLQLNATGGESYVWSPPIALNNPNIANPVATFDAGTEYMVYQVLAVNQIGCTDRDTLQVRVFKTVPQVFVPNAFSPNGDGRNDFFRFTAAGMKQIDYFRVYNRWGQLVYDSPAEGRGWDGRIKGKDQGSGTFVWMIQGVDYTGKVFVSKGTVTLIR